MASTKISNILASYISLFLVAALLVALRIYVKIRIVRNWGPEDYACIFALVCAINSTYFFCREAALADQGYDLTQVGLERLSQRLLCVYACSITYKLAIIAVKFSLLLQYLRIFPSRTKRVAIWTVAGIVTVISVWSFFSSVFICWPIRSFWALSVPGVRDNCLDLTKYYISHAGLSVGSDILILILPIPGLRQLMLRRAQKIRLILVFMLGGLVCLASILRLVAFVEAFDGSLNMDWAGFSVGLWTAIEMNVAIMCSCLPILRPFATRIWSKSMETKSLKRARVYSSNLLSSEPSSLALQSYSSSARATEKLFVSPRESTPHKGQDSIDTEHNRYISPRSCPDSESSG